MHTASTEPRPIPSVLLATAVPIHVHVPTGVTVADIGAILLELVSM